ncbi:hypothetical protein DPM13_04970 [Paracoccus mutanolyticus]|uniref:Uncharacterized protein n=1 Tax=Paracoccus mutanolyticus TaxID=1499308 RepID=A0ABN5M7K5_9RHOB|nr:hypothetical protein DPM13_04970 [Paracoccus mutanolyticus]
MVAARGGAGDDTITGAGRGIDIDGGAGDDRIGWPATMPGAATTRCRRRARRRGRRRHRRDRPGRGGLGDAGDDSLPPRAPLRIDGGVGADIIDVAGVVTSCQSRWRLGRRAARDADVAARLAARARASRQRRDETLRLRERRHRRGGRRRPPTLDESAPGSSTLIGGAGDDAIEGAGQANPGQRTGTQTWSGAATTGWTAARATT